MLFFVDLKMKKYLLFFIGVALGIQIVRKDIYPYKKLRLLKNHISNKKSLSQEWKLPKINKSEAQVRIPIEYYPKFVFKNNENGEKTVVMENAHDTLIISPDKVGMILIDTWGSNESDSAISEQYKKIKSFLLKARKNNFTIIHAPNFPVVEKYPQFHKIKEIVKDSLDKISKNRVPVFLDWSNVSYDSYNYLRHARKRSKSIIYQDSPISERDISFHLRPTMNEYVLESTEELRYVLWRNKIEVLIYVGGDLNECMLFRPTGINLFKLPGKTLPISIIVLEDCSNARGSLLFNDQLFSSAMIELYKQHVFISQSEDIYFLQN
jgi:hypothetical protein